MKPRRDLFLVGFLILFLELACIRWFGVYVVFMQYFANSVLLACFLGMSLGCLAARGKTDWLGRFPLLASASIGLALATYYSYARWSGVAIDVGTTAQNVFFGTDIRKPNLARFVVPMEVVIATFFTSIALVFVGPGQVMGRGFAADPDRLKAYAANIAGSLAGIAGFSLLSWWHASPLLWFAPPWILVVFFLRQQSQITAWRLGLLVVSLAAIVASGTERRPGLQTEWSPYYKVVFYPESRSIQVNSIPHQVMVDYDVYGAEYSLPFLLQRSTDGPPPRRALIIGAGSGNDVAHALRHGVEHVDAVEIDPAIHRIGVAHHPNRPYADRRVRATLDDGRHFLRGDGPTYDLIVYGLVDSLILHSSYSSVRLESYLFTREALADVRRRLAPDGVFVMYNYYRKGWIIQRAAALAESVFGEAPLIVTLPSRPRIGADDTVDEFTVLICGAHRRFKEAFAKRERFWMSLVPALNRGRNGFALDPATLPEVERATWVPLTPTTSIATDQTLATTDDWPFPYLRRPFVPDVQIRGIALLAAIGLAMLFLFLPKHGKVAFDNRLFWLGAGFMLLETKAVVQLALLFGSTWFVNSAVFFVLLVLVLVANGLAMALPRAPVAVWYCGLAAALAANCFVPTALFLEGSWAWRFLAPCALALAPIVFAGAVFSQSFRTVASPDLAFGANIAGSLLGGLAENLSLVVGFRGLLVVAAIFYACSMWRGKPKGD